MKKLLLVAVAAAAVYFAWTRFGPVQRPSAAGSADTVPAANAQNRINALSGAAPE
jgi:hypothetical protein